MGLFFADRFYLIVSMEYVPEDAELLHLRDLFQQASNLLHDATEGRHAIGKIFYAAGFGSDVADILIYDNLGAGADSSDARLWIPSKPVHLYRGNLADVVGVRPFEELQGDLFDATTIVHELGHYLYGLLDEYLDASTYGCVNSDLSHPPLTACLMEQYPTPYHSLWSIATVPAGASSMVAVAGAVGVFGPGGPSQFCWGVAPAGNHDSTTLTFQNAQVDDLLRTKLSCWSWMAHDANHDNIPYGLVEPAGGPVGAALAPPALDPLEELIPVERIGLVLDRSGSMLGPKLEGLKVGSEVFIEQLEAGQEFAMISFSDAATVATPLEIVPAGSATAPWKTHQKYLASILTATGATAIGDALDLGRLQLSSVDVAAVQSLLLLTGGMETAGSLPAEQAIPDLVANNVRVFAIGFGTDQNASFLQKIATATGGKYWPIAESLSAAEIANALPEVMIYASGEIPEGSMVTAFADLDERIAVELESRPFAWGQIPDPPAVLSQSPPAVLSHPIEISAGSKECTLGCFWSRPGAQFDLELIRPDKVQATDKDISRSFRGPRPYAFHVLKRPMPGTWQLRIRGQEIRGTRFRVFGFQVHPKIRLEASVERAIVRPGDEVELRVSVLIPQRIPGATVRAWILSPTGKWSRVDLLERSAEEPDAGIYVARIPTIPHVRGGYLVGIDVSRGAGRASFRPWPASRLESGRPPRAKIVDIPSLRLRKLVSFVADDSGRYVGKPLHGTNTKPLSVPADQRARVQEWKERRLRR